MISSRPTNLTTFHTLTDMPRGIGLIAILSSRTGTVAVLLDHPVFRFVKRDEREK
eukprot:IDg22033t1